MKKSLLTLAMFLGAHRAEAACVNPNEYDLIAPFGTLSGCVDLKTYLAGMYTTIIGIAGIVAVVLIVWCGIKLMTSGSAGGKSEAKKCITNAIFGLLLAVGSWILLYTINPFLLINQPTAGVVPALLPVSPPIPTVPTGLFSWRPGPSCPAVSGTVVSIASPSACAGPAPGPGSICCEYVAVPLTPPTGTPLPPPTPPIIPPYVPVPGPGPVWIDRAALSVNEASGTASVIVYRGGDILGNVDYTVIGASAVSGADFTVVSGTLVFPPGLMQQTITIPIINDTAVEGNEQFTVMLSNATGGLFMGSPTTRTVYIIDDDSDNTAPIVSILYPITAVGTVTTTPTIGSVLSVTEETRLSRVDLMVMYSGSATRTYQNTFCGSNPTCPMLGGTFSTSTTRIGPTPNEFYDLVGKACDSAGNCGYATKTIGYTLECTSWTSTVTRRCFTLPTGVGATSSPTVPGRTNSHLVKLNSPSGGGTISVTTVALTYDWYGESCTDAMGLSFWCANGCDRLNPTMCNAVPTVPICGGLTCPYGCAVDWYTPTCNLVPPPPVCGGVSCPAGCAVDPDTPICFVPPPVVIGSLTARPGDLSVGAPCGNGGSLGTMILNITFGTSTGCVIKPYFNYFLNISASDGKPHNFQINYNWLP